MEDKLSKLNPMQREAVLCSEGPLLVLAGAGSGKTRVLTHKIAYLIENGVSGFNILAITFTNKAAKEMKERVCDITKEGGQVHISTFHSFCVRVLRRRIDYLGYSKNFSIYDAEDSEKLIKEIMKEFKIDDKTILPGYIASKISSLKDKLISPEEFEQKNYTDYKEKIAIEVYKEYQKRLFKNQALDFDDLIFKTVELFRKNEQILEEYRERFRYILVDEYQDTSKAQYELIKLLGEKYRNVCVVGDDDQSIYGFRGADIGNILNFEKDFKEARTIKLEQNYRSSKKILDSANAVISHNFGRKDKSLWTENETGENIEYTTLKTDKEEANFIANEIVNKIKAGYKLNDIAVLYRKNSLSRLIEEKLMFLSVPYRVFGGLNFYSRKEIKDILAYLRLIVNTTDDLSLKRIINVPKRGIGEVTLDVIRTYSKENNVSMYKALKELKKVEKPDKKQQLLIGFLDIIEGLREVVFELSVSDFIKKVLKDTGYIKELEEEGTIEAQSRLENLQEFINKAVEFENNEEIQEKNIISFLEDVALVADAKDSGSDEYVSLMTIHTSKGLEFPIVFLAGFEDNIFPSYFAISDVTRFLMEEERRLLYVAITRAKEKLYITNASNRLNNGSIKMMQPSCFLKEIPKEFLNENELNKNKNSNVDVKNSNTANGNTNKYRPNPAYKPNVPVLNKKEIPVNKNVVIDFKEGDYVKHFKFGKGKVLSINPSGADYEVDIDFGEKGIKKLMANLSKLRKYE